ncbi:replication initiator protein A [Brucella pseudogrignonensis]|uniref:replication initiator protein A n=1 Tax=Brucella pseudogrignonensis TaxID=419475 RepID=UPI00124D16EE|nr:replication initiator protein A [Brucella pseudogrignonensis]KAB2688815.1 replication initiator protein A [Brucella pseudogrignonensis]
MAVRRRSLSERGQLDLFRALPGDFAPRDAQDLMAYPFFSLSKTHRVAPIDFVAGNVTIRVEAVPDHGMATIWDADILIWAASQIVEARDNGLRTSRLMAATPYEILTYVGRGTSSRDYQRLKAALDRLQSTTVSTSIRQPAEGRRHRFSWINEWQERTDRNGRPEGIELIVPDWFYQAVLDDALVLTIDRTYFDLTGGLDRWLYRLVRKHGGRQRDGWRFDFRHLHQKSGSLSPFKRFAFELRDIIRRQPLPGYRLFLEAEIGGRLLLAFEPSPACGQPVDSLVLSGTRTIVLSGTRGSCYQEPKQGLTHGNSTRNRALNLESNKDSNLKARARDVENLIRDAARSLSATARKSAPAEPPQTATSRPGGASPSTDPDTSRLPLDPPGGRR